MPTSASHSTATPTGSSPSTRPAGSWTGTRCSGSSPLSGLARGALAGRTLVVSVLSNGGLQHAVEAAGGPVVRTPVGDKYILEGMQVSGAGLGGEKSGHVIIREHTTSGDGIVTALELLRVMSAARQPLADLAAAIPLLPQQQRAVRVRHKDQWEGDPILQRAIRDAVARLGDAGRILVRPSGTEACAAGDGRGPGRGGRLGAGRHPRGGRERAATLTAVPISSSQELPGRRPGHQTRDLKRCAASSATRDPVRRGRSSWRGFGASSTAAMTPRESPSWTRRATSSSRRRPASSPT